MAQNFCKWDKSVTFSDQISVHFGSQSQNLLKSDLKKSRICSILGIICPTFGQNQATPIIDQWSDIPESPVPRRHISDHQPWATGGENLQPNYCWPIPSLGVCLDIPHDVSYQMFLRPAFTHIVPLYPFLLISLSFLRYSSWISEQCANDYIRSSWGW